MIDETISVVIITIIVVVVIDVIVIEFPALDLVAAAKESGVALGDDNCQTRHCHFHRHSCATLDFVVVYVVCGSWTVGLVEFYVVVVVSSGHVFVWTGA